MMLIFSDDVSSLPFVINAGLLIVNLLPLKNLDGGRFLYNLLMLKTDGADADRFLFFCEILTAAVLCVILAVSLAVFSVNASFVLFSLMIVVMTVSEIFEYKKC